MKTGGRKMKIIKHGLYFCLSHSSFYGPSVYMGRWIDLNAAREAICESEHEKSECVGWAMIRRIYYRKLCEGWKFSGLLEAFGKRRKSSLDVKIFSAGSYFEKYFVNSAHNSSIRISQEYDDWWNLWRFKEIFITISRCRKLHSLCF